VHVAHVSTAESVEIDPVGQGQGIAVTAEVTPHHLRWAPSCSPATTRSSRSTRRCAPTEDVELGPARPRRRHDRRVATDHAPHARHDKEHAFPEAAFGMLGLETALAVVAETLCTCARA
jgi:dihydroorotase